MGNSDTKMKPRHNGVHESLKERNDAIYRDYMDGVCVVDLADKYGVSGYRIVQILRSDSEYGLEKTRLNWQRNTQAKRARNKEIYEDYINGVPYNTIAEKWGMTSSGIQAIAKKYQKDLEINFERTVRSAPKTKKSEIDWAERKRRLIDQARAIPNQSLSNLAKQYGLTPNEARKILREAGIIKCPRNDLSDEALWAGIGGSYDDIY